MFPSLRLLCFITVALDVFPIGPLCRTAVKETDFVPFAAVRHTTPFKKAPDAAVITQSGTYAMNNIIFLD